MLGVSVNAWCFGECLVFRKMLLQLRANDSRFEIN